MKPHEVATPPTEIEIAEVLSHADKESSNIIRRLTYQRDILKDAEEKRPCYNTGCPEWFERYQGNCKRNMSCVDYEPD